ncbi:MAG: hypothetical protein Q7S65_00685 [Nanoarchaeota archaeon]|nr:hypothetical protein [Nanoarchaeota archaeon]
MDSREKIRAFLELKGPSLPYAVSKEMGLSVTFASAYLAEMSDRGMVRISNIKVGGGSPVYYLPGQEAQLQSYANNLGEKQKRVYDLLKEKQVLQDRALEPVMRAAIRDIKDFAVKCEAKNGEAIEIFWKWYLLQDEEAKKLTAQLLGVEEKKQPSAAQPKVERPTETPREKVSRPTQPQQKTLQTQEARVQRPSNPPSIQAQIQKEIVIEKPQEKTEKHKASELYREVLQFFQNKGITVIEENVLRKTEMDFIVRIPSPAGDLRYFVKAKGKKSISDGDLSSLFFQAQSKRLPALFLSKGDLTKKAKEMLDKEFHGMKVVHL